MNSFLNAFTTNDRKTENEMPAHSTSGGACLDLFFNLGTRNLSDREAIRLFSLAFGENPQLALRILFYNRDIRQGRGERKSFRTLIRLLADEKPEIIGKFLSLVPEYGRWDDLFVTIGTPLEKVTFKIIEDELLRGNALLAKWLPRKGPLARKLREALGLRPKAYRKTLVALTRVVETPMCAREWGSINYNQVPSRAGTIYAEAFFRHDPERYGAWRKELEKPREERAAGTKINVGTLYPHEIVAKARENSSYPFEAAWGELKDLFPTFGGGIIPVCDVSGSMMGLPLDVSVSLGIFLSEKNSGPFKDCFITFSERPELQRLSGSLRDKLRQLETSRWMMNTNLEAVFSLIARASRDAKPSDVPSTVLILSDMQFDQCITSPSDNALQMIDRQFAELGLKRPKIVFWNLRAVSGTLPVKAHQSGAALVSGFSPSALRALLEHPDEFTPEGIMLSTVNTPRYAAISL